MTFAVLYLFASSAVMRRGQTNTSKIFSLITINFILLTGGSLHPDMTAEFRSIGETFADF